MNEIQTANKLIKEQSASIQQLKMSATNAADGCQPPPCLPAPPPTTVTNLSSLSSGDIKTWLGQPRSTYIGRRSDKRGLNSSKWQNPYIREEYGEKCLQKFEKSIRGDEELIAALPELRGKELGCFCVPNSSCHGEVLIELLEEFHGGQPAMPTSLPPHVTNVLTANARKDQQAGGTRNRENRLVTQVAEQNGGGRNRDSWPMAQAAEGGHRCDGRPVMQAAEHTDGGYNRNSQPVTQLAEPTGGVRNRDGRPAMVTTSKGGPATEDRPNANSIPRNDAGYVRVSGKNNKRRVSPAAENRTNDSSKQRGRAKIVVLMDSNRNNIDFHALFPNAAEVVVKQCSNIPSAHNEIQRGRFGCDPTDVIIHVGTNDSDVGTPQGVADSLCRLAEVAASSTGAMVHLSQLTPRKDELGMNALETNKILASQVNRWPSNVRMVTHPELSTRHLRDAKHLNRYRVDSDIFAGSQLFSADLYKAVNGNYPSNDIMRSSKKWHTPADFNV